MKSTKDERKRTQEATVHGLFKIYQKLGSDCLFSIIPFEGTPTDNPRDYSAVKRALEEFKYNTGYNALDGLNKCILPKLEGQMEKKLSHPRWSW